MCDLIEEECEGAEADLEAACERSLAHGALLATRYLLAEMTFRTDAAETEAKLKVGEKAIGFETRPRSRRFWRLALFRSNVSPKPNVNSARRDDARFSAVALSAVARERARARTTRGGGARAPPSTVCRAPS